jgi:rubrerythrin
MSADDEGPRQRLIAILQHAFSGERAAGYAYNGHWKAAVDPGERERIRQIEDEEWHHRRLVGEMLTSLGSGPQRLRELRAALIGRALGLLCHLSPWFLPMYGAGWLESHNIVEYENAARHARGCGRDDLVDCLLTMAEVEWDHEAYFRSKVVGHSWSRIITVWRQPPPKAAIRRDEPPLGKAALVVGHAG